MTREKYNNGLECLLRSHLRSRLHHPVNRLSSPDRPARRIRFHESVTEATQFVSYEKTPKKKTQIGCKDMCVTFAFAVVMYE